MDCYYIPPEVVDAAEKELKRRSTEEPRIALLHAIHEAFLKQADLGLIIYTGKAVKEFCRYESIEIPPIKNPCSTCGNEVRT